MNHLDEIETLLTAMKETKNKRMYERYQTIHLYLKGYIKEEVATIIGRSEKTVYNYINAYTQHGINGLDMKYSPELRANWNHIKNKNWLTSSNTSFLSMQGLKRNTIGHWRS